MTSIELLRHRQANQHISVTQFTKAEELVSHLLAMQAQLYPMAKWAIGLRVPGTSEGAIEKAFNDGKILRTHLMRPTWHFVMPKDIRWLIELTGPRVQKIMAPYDKQLGLTPSIFKRSIDILAKELEGGKYLDRTALRAALSRKKLPLAENRLSHILMHAELECIICSGPRRGKQFTYALFDERAPNARSLDREEALAEIALRYFSTRSPATLQDFMWWSGLVASDGRKGVSMLPKHFVHRTINGKEYIVNDAAAKPSPKTLTSFIMPDYDEYGIAYKDRSALLSKQYYAGATTMYSHYVVIDGLIEGTWEQSQKGKAITIETTPFGPLSKTKQQALKKAVERYYSFWKS